MDISSSSDDRILLELCASGTVPEVSAYIEEKHSSRIMYFGCFETAAKRGRSDIVRLLCEKVEPDDRGFEEAAKIGQLDVMRVFEDLRPKYAERCRGHALVAACKSGCVSSVKWILNEVRRKKIDEFFLQDGFLVACARGNVDVCRVFFEDSLEYILDDKYIKMGYVRAALGGKSRVLKYLDKHADILWLHGEKCVTTTERSCC